MNALESARELANSYVDYAPRSVSEVKRRLERANYEEVVIATVVEDMINAGLLNDAKLSEDWVESRVRAKKLGRIRLSSELRRKGVSREDADRALESLDFDSEVAAAVEAAARKLSKEQVTEETGPAELAALKRRMAGYLQRRGYKWEIIEQVFTKVFANED